MKALALICLLVLTPAWAEEHASDNPTPTASEKDTVKRPKQKPTELKGPEVRLLSAMFRVSTGAVKRLFGGAEGEHSIPRAVDAALEGDEAPLARIVSDLYGTLNREQADGAIELATKAREAELKRQPRDPRFGALLDRLFWAGKILNGQPSEVEGSEKYNTAFNEAFAKREARNAQIKEKVKDALAGNNKAKDFLRDTFNRDTVLSFIEAQRKSGNKKLAADLVEALSFQDGKNRFLDLVTAKGETHRINLGPTRASLEKTLDGYAAKKGAFHLASLAKSPHTAPTKTFTLKVDGKVAPQRPIQKTAGTSGRTDASPATSRASTGGSPRTATRGSGAPQSTGPSTSGTTQSSPPASRPSGPSGAAAFQSFVSNNCTGCHNQDPVGTADLRIKKGDKTMSISDAVAALNRVPSMRSGVPENVRKQLEGFAR